MYSYISADMYKRDIKLKNKTFMVLGVNAFVLIFKIMTFL